uniref:Unannotated protein n=1 Tax=freshwater metagenome TaxID=449393 RepID=A0A6J5ZCG9_9ZZZZ
MSGAVQNGMFNRLMRSNSSSTIDMSFPVKGFSTLMNRFTTKSTVM